MLFDNISYHAMQSGLDALWMKQNASLQNIANYETPGYKAKTVSFEDVLKSAEGRTGTGNYNFKALVGEDATSEVRPDGNNVNMDRESTELYRNYVQSLYLYQKISGQFSDIRYVMEQSFK